MADAPKPAGRRSGAAEDDELSPWRFDADRQGDLSIVVQSGLSASNMVELANNVRHWRRLFPAAEIILSLSGSDILLAEPSADGVLTTFDLAPEHARDTIMRTAWRVAGEASDRVLLVDGVLPLPPIKADTARANNVNLQIAAARNGLHHARGRYVLRVRGDLTFGNRGFIEQYRRDHDLPRGEAAVLRQRVLISWLYTLDPYAAERLPLHFSDWFNFGLAEDVRRLWDVGEMSLDDTTFFLTNDLPRDSGFEERLFNMRLAVEQHITFEAFRPAFDDLSLDRFNDIESRELSLDILADNYVLCDLRATAMLFPKYQNELFNDRKPLVCITPEKWRALAEMRFVSPRLIVHGDTNVSNDADAAELRAGFPRRYGASDLGSAQASVRRGVLVSEGGGNLFVSRAIRLPPGRFRAALAIEGAQGAGMVTLAASLEGSDQPLASASAYVDGRSADAGVTFEIARPYGPRIRLAAEMAGLRSLAIRGFAIDRASPRDEDEPMPRQLRLEPEATGAGPGTRFSGRLALKPGRYVAAVNLPGSAFAGEIALRVADRRGAVLAETIVPADPARARGPTLDFDIATVLDRPLELVLVTDRCTEPPLALVAERSADTLDTPFPRFYDTLRLRAGNARYEDDRIVATGTKGLLFFGPYVSVAPGRYSADVSVSQIAGAGTLFLSVTSGIGARELARRTIAVRDGAPVDASIPFDVDEPVHMLEVVCRMTGLKECAIAGVTLRERGSGAPSPREQNAFAAQAPSPAGWRRLLSHPHA